MNVGIIKGRNVGLGNGAIFGACFMTYALGFWYGAKIIADDMDGGCTDDCITGGNILAVFFSVILGSIALGQVAPPLTAFAGAMAAAYSMFEIIQREPLIDGLSTSGETPTHDIKGAIEIKNIRFAYPARPEIDVCKGCVQMIGTVYACTNTYWNYLMLCFAPNISLLL